MPTLTSPTDTARTLDDAHLTALVTSLFSTGLRPRGAEATSGASPRAAFQDALYGRAVLVDIRPGSVRALRGAPDAPHRAIEATGAGLSQILTLGEQYPVLLLSADGTSARHIASLLRESGLAWVDSVDGGFAAWERAGLPRAEI